MKIIGKNLQAPKLLRLTVTNQSNNFVLRRARYAVTPTANIERRRCQPIDQLNTRASSGRLASARPERPSLEFFGFAESLMRLRAEQAFL